MNRRNLLKQIASAGLLLPFGQNLISPAFAAGAKRLVILYFPSGAPTQDQDGGPVRYNDESYWHRNTFDQLSWMQSPLAPYKSDLILMNGLNLGNEGQGHHDTHMLWTGGTGDGSSLDFEIAKVLGNKPALNLACFAKTNVNEGYSTANALAYNSGHNIAEAIHDPQLAFDLKVKPYIGTGGGGGGTTNPKLLMLQALEKDFASLQAKALSVTEKNKVDSQAQALAEFKATLDSTIDDQNNTSSKTYTRPTVGAQAALETNVQNSPIKEVIRAQMDNIVGALKFGVTNVATLQVSRHTNNLFMDFAEINQVYASQGNTSQNAQKRNHGASHEGDRSIHRSHWYWFTQQVAYLAGELKKEGLLSSTLVLVTTEVADGNSHSEVGLPWFTVGGTEFVRAGRVIDCGGVSHPNALLGVAKALGAGWGSFGNSSGSVGLS